MWKDDTHIARRAAVPGQTDGVGLFVIDGADLAVIGGG
jgi:hypothetical protein